MNTKLVYALSGLGKTTLAQRNPELILDADEFLYQALERSFPQLQPRERPHAWRSLCQSKPWATQGKSLKLWATTRRDYIATFDAALRCKQRPIVLTSHLTPQWPVTLYVGITHECYISHLQLVGRLRDNHQSEALNRRLDGHEPLIRLPPGSHLADCPKMIELVAQVTRQ